MNSNVRAGSSPALSTKTEELLPFFLCNKLKVKLRLYIKFFYLCQMKKIVPIIVLLYMLKPIFPLVSYVIQYDYIVNELCVNKDKPLMHCNGKCHLMKELSKVAESEKQNTKDYKFPVLENILFLNKISDIEINKDNFSKTIHHFLYTNSYTYLIDTKILQPPVFFI